MADEDYGNASDFKGNWLWHFQRPWSDNLTDAIKLTDSLMVNDDHSDIARDFDQLFMIMVALNDVNLLGSLSEGELNQVYKAAQKVQQAAGKHASGPHSAAASRANNAAGALMNTIIKIAKARKLMLNGVQMSEDMAEEYISPIVERIPEEDIKI